MQTSSSRTRADIEPLARSRDLAEYREGLARFVAGEWDDGRWTSFRLHYGIYGQRQPGQMVRIRIPGGVVPVGWLRALARLASDFAQGPLHLTTRQDVQIYNVALERTPDLLERLLEAGITTREAGGNTLRNVTACGLAGLCPAERVDAGAVADRLSRAWLRQPLVQNMPRKVKVSVSGCATDCGVARFHDLGLIAVERDGRPGFRVLAGGGVGAQPIPAVEVAGFVTEEDLPTVLEALVRVHIAHSTREDRGQARLKFVLRRLGAERFTALFSEEFARLRGLGQRPWPPLAWRRPEPDARRPSAGPVTGHDGLPGLLLRVPLGLLEPDQLDGLARAVTAHGLTGVRLTRDQMILISGLRADQLPALVADLASIGLDGSEQAARHAPLVSCPGAATCRIGITTSRALGQKLLADGAGTDGLPVHVSGCHNSCTLHPLAAIGLRGMTRTINGRVAPHYRIHLGGDFRDAVLGVEGPVVPARLADRAVGLLREAIATGRRPEESVRDWAERLGPEALAALLAPLGADDPDSLFVDWGETRPFEGPPKAKGECAAPQVGVEHLGDLAIDALANFDRFLAAGRWPEALKAAEEATSLVLRRLLSDYGIGTSDSAQSETVHALFRSSPAGHGRVLDGFDSVQAERTAALVTGTAESYREAVAAFLDLVRSQSTGRQQAETPPDSAVGDIERILAGGVE